MTLPRGATVRTLRRRAELLARTRRFFAERDVLEVETASLSAAATPDPALHSIQASGRAVRGFLHTSPEYMMKRLLADGSGDIFQICRVYRGGELGRWHEPEFTMLEWYRVGFDDFALMHEVAALLRELLGDARLASEAQFLSYDGALESALGLNSAADTKNLSAALARRGVSPPSQATRNDLLDLAMTTLVVRHFPEDALTFVHDYPADQAALARLRSGTPPTAARFEVFVGRVELGNGFHELTDAPEQRQRFERENGARLAAGLDAMPIDAAFLAALESGLPDCAGVALGFDRIVAVALGAASVAEVLAFCHGTGEL